MASNTKLKSLSYTRNANLFVRNRHFICNEILLWFVLFLILSDAQAHSKFEYQCTENAKNIYICVYMFRGHSILNLLMNLLHWYYCLISSTFWNKSTKRLFYDRFSKTIIPFPMHAKMMIFLNASINRKFIWIQFKNCGNIHLQNHQQQ